MTTLHRSGSTLLNGAVGQATKKRMREGLVGPRAIAGDPRRILQECFGMSSFKQGQDPVIKSLLAGHSALAIFPTGGGKSLCYQLPALMLPDDELTLVVSPLIALMKDQCDGLLRRLSVSASCFVPSPDVCDMYSSALNAEQRAAVRRRVEQRKTKILLIAPEQVTNEVTRAMIFGRQIGLLAIDEAHCISEWGHAFRPDYLRLAGFAKDCAADRVLCLTATATPKVEEDICTMFGIDQRRGHSVRSPFHRHNLKLSHAVVSEASRDAALVQYIKHRPPRGPTIVYCTRQDTTERVAALLRDEGLPARAYHAGMDAEVRTEVQDWFMSVSTTTTTAPLRGTSSHPSDCNIVVATIAFGMGIDKTNIRHVIHYNLAKSLEGYAQEIGRAGRDGLDSYCHTFLCWTDVPIVASFAHFDTPSATSIYGLLSDLFVDGYVGRKVEISLFRAARTHDVKETVVRMLFSFVDIYHGHINTLTPKYSSFKLQPIGVSKGNPANWDLFRSQVQTAITNPPGFGAIVNKSMVCRATWAYIDLDQAATDTGFPRQTFVEALDQLQRDPLIHVRGEGLLHVFDILSIPASLATLAREEHKRFIERERRELSRLEDVIDFISPPKNASSCKSKLLMQHFGYTMPDDWNCGDCCRHCRSLRTNRSAAAAFEPYDRDDSAALAALELIRQNIGEDQKLLTAGEVPAAVWQDFVAAVAKACVPMEPRLLARFGFGSKSPRIAAAKLDRAPGFGMLEGKCEFLPILKKCEELCQKKDHDI